MNNLSTNTPKGLSRHGLRIWGLMFLVLGIAGKSILQNRMLGVGSISNEELLKLIQNQDQFAMASVAIVLQFVMACAIPIFVYLLVDGFGRTSSFKNYLLRITGVAVLSELPFNFAMSGKLLDLNSRNPVFAMVLGLVMLYIFQYYAGTGFKNVLIKVMVVALSILWVDMLRITDGAAIVVMVSALWALRKNRSLQIFGGCAAMFVCTIFSPFYLAAPLLFLTVHFYNGEPGDENKIINYLAYPAILLAIGLVAKFAF